VQGVEDSGADVGINDSLRNLRHSSENPFWFVGFSFPLMYSL
jgi:hypothetical protein